MGFTIEDAPDGFLVGGGCKNIGKLTRQGSAYMADVHHADDGSPPFPGETNPDVYAYHWQWNEIVTRTKKGRIRHHGHRFPLHEGGSRPAAQLRLQELPC